MLYLFGFDGTLVYSYRDRPTYDYPLVEVLLGRPEQLAPLLAAGHTVGIVTIQGGGVGEVVTEAAWADKIARALAALGLPATTPVAVSFAPARASARRSATPKARPPSTGPLIRTLMAAHPAAASDGVIFVGGSDEQAAAEEAGVAFQWWWEFFGEPA